MPWGLKASLVSQADAPRSPAAHSEELSAAQALACTTPAGEKLPARPRQWLVPESPRARSGRQALRGERCCQNSPRLPQRPAAPPGHRAHSSGMRATSTLSAPRHPPAVVIVVEPLAVVKGHQQRARTRHMP
jgi:hypothetical protein